MLWRAARATRIPALPGVATTLSRARLSSRPVAGAAADGPESAALAGEAKRLVEEALVQLPTSLRAPLVLHELEGLTYNEIASILRLPIGTVKSRIFRARLRIAEILEPHKEQWSS